jgi:hypothetical protein
MSRDDESAAGQRNAKDLITEAAKTGHFWFALLIAGSVALLLMGMGVASYFGKKASAATVEDHGQRLTKIEEWKKYKEKRDDYMLQRIDGVAEQLNQWALINHLPTAPTPSPPPTGPSPAPQDHGQR